MMKTSPNSPSTSGWVPALCTLIGLMLPGCAEPFASQDTRIEAPRFVYVAAEHATLEAGTEVKATALFYQQSFALEGDERALTWFMMDPPTKDAAALAAITARTPEALAATEGIIVLGSGPDLSFTFPETEGLKIGDSLPLGVAGSSAGETDFAYVNLTLGEAKLKGGDLGPATLEHVPSLDVLERGQPLSRASLSADARQAFETTPASPLILPGQATRISVPGVEMLWRHAGNTSTLLPLGDSAVDLLPGTLALSDDDDEEVLLSRDDAGIITLVGTPISSTDGAPVLQEIAFCPQGSYGPDCSSEGLVSAPIVSQWGHLFSVLFTYAVDLDSLMEAPQPLRISGEFFPTTNAEIRPYFGSAQVMTGSTLDEEDPYGVKALDCSHPIPLDRPFSFEHLVYGRCTFDQLAGHELIIDVELLPLPEAPE